MSDKKQEEFDSAQVTAQKDFITGHGDKSECNCPLEVKNDGKVSSDNQSNKITDLNISKLSDIPTNKDGKFDEWFDSISDSQVKELYKDKSYRKKIEKQLRGDGGKHEMLMVAEAPHWKEWGVSANNVKEKLAISIKHLNEKLAKNWKHSTGTKGSRAPNSTKVHNELQDIIKQSGSLEEYKQNLKPWVKAWIKGDSNEFLKLFD